MPFGRGTPAVGIARLAYGFEVASQVSESRWPRRRASAWRRCLRQAEQQLDWDALEALGFHDISPEAFDAEMLRHGYAHAHGYSFILFISRLLCLFDVVVHHGKQFKNSCLGFINSFLYR